MTKLHIAGGLDLALDFVTSTQAILAQKGKGKSYTASVEAEELLEAGQQVVVIDPTDAWWGLRSSADGRSRGYPIVVIGGDHGDLPLEHTAGEVLARAIADQHFSAILCTELLRKGEEQRFVAAFLDTLYRKNRHAMHLFIDEADVFAPQKPFGEEAKTLGACEDVVRRGRKKGIGCTLITQRAAVLNKNVLSQADQLVALGINHPKDLDAIGEWVKVHADPKRAADMLESLPSLPRGEAWVWAPARDLFRRVKIRERRTFDSGKTPVPGEWRKHEAKVLAEIDLARLGAIMSETVERVRATDPKALSARVAELERELAAARRAPAKVETKIVEKRMIDEKHIKKLERLTAKLQLLDARLREQLDQVHAQTVEVRKALHIAEAWSRPSGPTPAPPLTEQQRRDRALGEAIAATYKEGARRIGASREPREPARPSLQERVAKSFPGGGIVPAQQRLLDTIALLERLGVAASRETLAAWYGTHPNSKGFHNNLSALRSSGLVDGVTLTDKGRAAAATIDIPTQDEARARILKPLTPKQRQILELLIGWYPGKLGREQLAKELGMHPNSKSLNNNLSALRSRQLITREWPTRAGDVLFIEGSR